MVAKLPWTEMANISHDYPRQARTAMLVAAESAVAPPPAEWWDPSKPSILLISRIAKEDLGYTNILPEASFRSPHYALYARHIRKNRN